MLMSIEFAIPKSLKHSQNTNPSYLCVYGWAFFFFAMFTSHLHIVCRFVKHMIIKSSFVLFFYLFLRRPIFSGVSCVMCFVVVLFCCCIPCVLMCVHVCPRLFVCLFVCSSDVCLYILFILFSFTQPNPIEAKHSLYIARAIRTTAHKELNYENVKRQMPYHIWSYV